MTTTYLTKALKVHLMYIYKAKLHDDFFQKRTGNSRLRLSVLSFDENLRSRFSQYEQPLGSKIYSTEFIHLYL